MFYLFYWWTSPDGHWPRGLLFLNCTERSAVSCANECQSRSKVKLMMRFDTRRLPCRRHRGFTPSKGGAQTQGARNKTSEQAVLFFENTFYYEFQSLTTNDLTSVWLTANIYSLWWKSSAQSLIRWDMGSGGLAIWGALIKSVCLMLYFFNYKIYFQTSRKYKVTKKLPHTSGRGIRV